MTVHEIPEEEAPKIVLPEDKPIKLFVLSEASNLVITEMFTDVVYDNEIHVKQISALTRMGRDLDDAYQQRLAGELRKAGDLSDLHTEGILKRPPNWITLFAIAFVTIVILAYAQYSGNLQTWGAGLQAGAGYIVAAVILLMALFLMLRLRTRRPKK